MKRVERKVRHKQLLDIAVNHAIRVGYFNITREAIANEAGVAESLVSHIFGSIPKLKRAVMRAAVREGVLPVVAQGLAQGDTHAMKAPLELREKAIASLMEV